MARFGQYELLERISVGGMAEVFRARVTAGGTGRDLAIKRILPHLCDDDLFIEMFVTEARLTARLHHVNIARVHDFGVIDGLYFLAMDLIEGQDLRWIQKKLTAQNDVVPVPTAVHIVMCLCNALSYAHGLRDEEGRPLGIVHRDISPQNILISFSGEVLLVDFGIAKARLHARETTHGRLKGKCAYMAPEQIRGMSVNSRADLFGVGAVLHELLTGKPLFLSASQVSTLQRVLHGRIPAPSEQNPRVPSILDDITLRALSRDVSLRYQDADQLHASLQRYCAERDAVLHPEDIAQWMRQRFGLEAVRKLPATQTWGEEKSGITQPLGPKPSRRKARQAPHRVPHIGSYAPAQSLQPSVTRPLPGPAKPAEHRHRESRISRLAHIIERQQQAVSTDDKRLHRVAAVSTPLPMPEDDSDLPADTLPDFDDESMLTAPRDAFVIPPVIDPETEVTGDDAFTDVDHQRGLSSITGASVTDADTDSEGFSEVAIRRSADQPEPISTLPFGSMAMGSEAVAAISRGELPERPPANSAVEIDSEMILDEVVPLDVFADGPFGQNAGDTIDDDDPTAVESGLPAGLVDDDVPTTPVPLEDDQPTYSDVRRLPELPDGSEIEEDLPTHSIEKHPAGELEEDIPTNLVPPAALNADLEDDIPTHQAKRQPHEDRQIAQREESQNQPRKEIISLAITGEVAAFMDESTSDPAPALDPLGEGFEEEKEEPTYVHHVRGEPSRQENKKADEAKKHAPQSIDDLIDQAIDQSVVARSIDEDTVSRKIPWRLISIIAILLMFGLAAAGALFLHQKKSDSKKTAPPPAATTQTLLPSK